MRVAAAFLLWAASCAAVSDMGVPITFVNPYTEAYELFWINPGEHAASPMGTIAAGAEVGLNSFVGHTFGWRRVTDSAGGETCHSDEVPERVTLQRGMVRHVLGEAPVIDPYAQEPARDPASAAAREPFTARFRNAGAAPMRLVPRRELGAPMLKDGGGTMAAAAAAAASGGGTMIDADEGNATIAPGGEVSRTVVLGGMLDWYIEATGELMYRSVVDKAQPGKVFTYRDDRHTVLCSDATPASSPTRTFTWTDALDGRELTVEVLREDPFIAYIPDWTAGDECASLERQALDLGLANAQVFGEQEMMVITDRRARSANLYWQRRDPTHVNNRLIERAFAFTAAQRGYSLNPGAPGAPGPGQEPLNFIRYGVADEYRPHCDGVCHRAPYARGGRVATLIHYCSSASEGGATVFPTAGLKVVPKNDSALLFAYKRDDGFMDAGNTQHTGCLVRGGQKQIVTMWMREDVTDTETWDKFAS